MNKLKNFRATLLLAIIASVTVCAQVDAQRPRFPDFFESASSSSPAQFQTPNASPPNINLPTLGTPNFGAPPSIINAPPIITSTPPPGFIQGQQPLLIPPGTVLQGGGFPGATNGLPPTNTPAYDPFRTNSTPFPIFPRADQPGQIYPAPNSRPLIGPNNNPPQIALPQVQVLPPQIQQPQVFAPNPYQQQQLPQIQPQFQQPGFGVPQYNLPAYGNQQPSSGWPNVNWAWPSQAWASLKTGLARVLERPRFRHTYLPGNNGNELQIHDVELATTLNRLNFLGTGQPLRISPGFVFHYWDGPDTAITGFDLPAKAYTAYLSLDHVTDPSRPSGMETNFTVGLYSDFDNFSSDGLRMTGTVLGWQRVNSYTTAKFGVEYFDRIDLKLLPAFGLFLSPNDDLKLDIYFPRPKLAQRIPSYANIQAWAYIGAEYGGGSWAIERLGGMDDQVDINDVRAFMGVEWLGARQVTGFLEVGYVFDREMLYRSNKFNKLELQDTVMIRSGIAF